MADSGNSSDSSDREKEERPAKVPHLNLVESTIGTSGSPSPVSPNPGISIGASSQESESVILRLEVSIPDSSDSEDEIPPLPTDSSKPSSSPIDPEAPTPSGSSGLKPSKSLPEQLSVKQKPDSERKPVADKSETDDTESGSTVPITKDAVRTLLKLMQMSQITFEGAEKYMCLKCDSLALLNIKAKCGHHICNNCHGIKQPKTEEVYSFQPTQCRFCNEEMVVSQGSHDAKFENELDNKDMTVKCLSCNIVVPMDKAVGHLIGGHFGKL